MGKKIKKRGQLILYHCQKKKRGGGEGKIGYLVAGVRKLYTLEFARFDCFHS